MGSLPTVRADETGAADARGVTVNLEDLAETSQTPQSPATQPVTASKQKSKRNTPDEQSVSKATTQPTQMIAGASTTVAQKANDEEIARILVDRPAIPITKPRDMKPKEPPGPKLAPENSMVVDRRCRLTRDPECYWNLLTFEANGDAPVEKRWALPCARLEEMEKIAAKDPNTVFRVSGETANFEKVSFFLVNKATVEGVDVTPSAVPTTQPVVTDTASTDPATTSAEDIIRAMEQDRPGAPVLVHSETKVKDVASVAPKGTQARLQIYNDELVADRIVIFTKEKDSNWWEARFRSDNTLQDPPIRVLPSRWLKLVVSNVEGSPRTTLRFKVSGQVTHYRGQRYLFIRKLFVMRDMGQF